MKKIFLYAIVLIVTFYLVSSCRKMDSTYENFIVPGGLIYPGKVTSPKVYAGKNRVKLSWLRGSDPTVTSAKVFWNNSADSVVVPIPATGDTISVIISNLEEKTYSFKVRTYDDKGNISIPVDLFGSSYGVKYQTGIEQLTRPINQANIDATGKVTLKWGTANKSGGAYATDVKYTDKANVARTSRTLVKEDSLIIADVKAGTTLQYTTLYLPDTLSIDTFYTASTTVFVAAKIPKAGLVVDQDSYQTSSLLPVGGPARLAFDDDINTYWHTFYTPAPVPVFPHWMRVDMVKSYTITRVELTSRQAITNGFTAFTIQGSTNGTTWTDYGSFTKIPQDATESFILDAGPKMRYIRVYATAGPAAYTSLAEFTAFGYE